VNPIFNLKNKNIIVTGASSGIGRQCAITFSQFGANVILIARNEEKLKQTFSKLSKGNHIIIIQDITEYDKLEEIVSTTVEKIGKISGFVHLAGIEMTLPLRSMSPSNYEKMFAVNVISGFELTKIISKKKYINKEGASLIFISSIMSVVSNSALVGYSASKGALVSAVRSMAIELAAKNIRVNCISPGHIEGVGMTKRLFKNIINDSKKRIVNLYPLGLGKPEDVSTACTFLLSDASRWITGTNLIVDGGYSAR
jgi:NAD(P)-dependent dehydrogenase (short-subunit alcohol dehydrogenase family)